MSEGIEAVLSQRKDSALDVVAVTALLSGALNEAALWIAEAENKVKAHRAMRKLLSTLLSRLFSSS